MPRKDHSCFAWIFSACQSRFANPFWYFAINVGSENEFGVLVLHADLPLNWYLDDFQFGGVCIWALYGYLSEIGMRWNAWKFHCGRDLSCSRFDEVIRKKATVSYLECNLPLCKIPTIQMHLVWRKVRDTVCMG